jgi:hypothetical protein
VNVIALDATSPKDVISADVIVCRDARDPVEHGYPVVRKGSLLPAARRAVAAGS